MNLTQIINNSESRSDFLKKIVAMELEHQKFIMLMIGKYKYSYL